MKEANKTVSRDGYFPQPAGFPDEQPPAGPEAALGDGLGAGDLEAGLDSAAACFL